MALSTRSGQSKVHAYISKRDGLIDLVKQLNSEKNSIEEAFREVEGLIKEHFVLSQAAAGSSNLSVHSDGGTPRTEPVVNSQLSLKVPGIGKFFHELPLVDALHEYDRKYFITSRNYVRASFREIRHIFNTAQIHAMRDETRLVTLDADGTLYDDGESIGPNSPHASLIISLLRVGIPVAIITAAGYHRAPQRYEERFQFLLEALKEEAKEARDRFFVIGGESNYFMKCDESGRLFELQDEMWMTTEMRSWKLEDIQQLLHDSKQVLIDVATKLSILHKFKIIEKPRAVGFIPVSKDLQSRNEAVDEMTLAVQRTVRSSIPFCCFNSNHQIWLDVGNKSLGVYCLQLLLHIDPKQTLHFGDQLLQTGNDYATRNRAATVWVTQPKETKFFLELLIKDIPTAATVHTSI